jgi:hypothetical protein
MRHNGRKLSITPIAPSFLVAQSVCYYENGSVKSIVYRSGDELEKLFELVSKMKEPDRELFLSKLIKASVVISES